MLKDKINNNLLSVLVMSVIAIWGISAAIILFFLDDWTARGTFGDLFGAVSALFSGLAFAGFIYANHLQKRDLDHQRAELKKTTKSQQHSEKALMLQVEQMKIAAKLNALNTIIVFYNQQILDLHANEEIVAKFKKKRFEAIREIDELIDIVDENDLD